MKLTGRVALVVGGASGLGRSGVLNLIREGASVAIADRQAEEAEKLASELKKSGAKAVGIKVDVTKTDDITAMMEEVLDAFGEVNILFHTAGWGNFQPFWDIDEKQWSRTIGVNLSGTFFVAQAVAKQMIAQKKGGKIILTGSNGAVTNCNRLSDYCVSKAGVVMLARCMAAELGNMRINVNVINPGAFETNMTKPMLEVPKHRNMLRATTPLGRWGAPDEIGKLVVFLASDDAEFITGQAINIDGGITLPTVPAWFPIDYTKSNEVGWV
jgi:3-oxoacyl-[acyl-carrier protein] reductase